MDIHHLNTIKAGENIYLATFNELLKAKYGAEEMYEVPGGCRDTGHCILLLVFPARTLPGAHREDQGES